MTILSMAARAIVLCLFMTLGAFQTALSQTSETGAVKLEADRITATDTTARPAQAVTHQTLSPLTVNEKIKLGLSRAFLSYESYLWPLLGAYLTEHNNVKAPGKTASDRYADGASRYASSFATRTTATVFASGIYPALFKQEPRYLPSERKGVFPRVLYAASRTFITQGDNGHTQINYSRLAGNFTSAALANIYERDTVEERDDTGRVVSFHRRSGVGPTFRRFGVSLPLGMAVNIVFDEFNLPGKLGNALNHIFKR